MAAFLRGVLARGPIAPFMLAALPTWGAGSVDEGRLAFNRNCFACHVEEATAPKYVPARFSPDYLILAFQTNFIMNGNLLLGSQTINDIATYLGLASLGQGNGNGNDTDRLLDWGEDTFPQLLAPARQPTNQAAGYTYRYYPATGVYAATKDDSVFIFDSRTPGATISNVGTLRSFLDQIPNGR